MIIKKQKERIDAVVTIKMSLPASYDTHRRKKGLVDRIHKSLGNSVVVVTDVDLDFTSRYVHDITIEAPDNIYDYKAIIKLIRAELKKRNSTHLLFSSSYEPDARIRTRKGDCKIFYNNKTVNCRYEITTTNSKSMLEPYTTTVHTKKFDINDRNFPKLIVDWIDLTG